MNAEIIAVGTELLLGQIVNTNAQQISVRLSEIGVDVYYHTVVGDNRQRIQDTICLALERSDIVITTGGLGPTQDDLTKEVVAELLGRRMVFDPQSMAAIEEYFRRSRRTLTENNRRQAYFPEGSQIIPNKRGTAPGCIVEHGNKIVIMLPGPTGEMASMLEETVIPFLKERSPYTIHSKVLRIFGLGESKTEEMIIDLIRQQSNPTIAPYAKDGEVTLRITAKSHSLSEAEELIRPVEEEIRRRLGLAVYGEGEMELEEVVVGQLMNHRMTLATAESCTGGLIAHKLTNVPGASRVFERGVISYSNEAKVQLLGVSPASLHQFGAVSSQVAEEMANGVRKLAGTDIGLGVTGIAGPSGGTPEKPVGLVFIALSTNEGIWHRQLNLVGNRWRIKNLTALSALDFLRRHLLQRNLI